MQLDGRLVASCFAIMLAGGCSGTPRPVSGINAVEPDRQLPVIAEAAVVGPSDVISINVFREPDLSSATSLVAPDGTVQMPLLGSVSVAGKSTAQISRELTQLLAARYLVDPSVSVNVVQAQFRSITVEGAVTMPGVYQMTPNTTLLTAIAISKGLTRVARREQVTVFRGTGSERYLGVFDLGAIEAGYSADVPLRAGDVIVVGVSGRRQTWQDFLQAAPLIGLFTRI